MLLPGVSCLSASLRSRWDGHGAGVQHKWGETGLVQPGEEKVNGEAVPAVLLYIMGYIREKMEPEMHSGFVQDRGRKLRQGKCK